MGKGGGATGGPASAPGKTVDTAPAKPNQPAGYAAAPGTQQASPLAKDATERIFPDAKKAVETDFEVGSVLGQGAFGVVRLVTSKKDGAKHACKTLSKARMLTERDIADTKNEVDILHHVKGHGNIVSIVEVYEDDNDVHVIMELCSGGELFDRIVSKGHYSEKDAAEALRTMLKILDHCHKNNIVHRDLKPENYLLDGPGEDATLKLTDFGLSAKLNPDEHATDVVGTPVYIAPEVLRGKYTHKADIWSCGCILYILLSGKLPFFGANEREELRATLAGKYDLSSPPWDKISAEAKDVVTLMLTMDVSARPDAATLLNHPWVREDGVAPSTPLGDSVVAGMKNFQQMNKLKKRALQVMATNMAPEDIKEMEKMFKEIDTDGSGTITIAELKEALKRSGKKLPEAEVEEMLSVYDVDGDGVIDYSEFVAATNNWNKLYTMENLDMAFKKFDLDGDGEITPDEVLEALKDCGVSMENVMDIIREADADGDGKIQYHEFVEMMKDRPEMKAQQRKQLDINGL